MVGLFLTCFILSILSIPAILFLFHKRLKKHLVIYLALSVFISSAIMFMPYYKTLVWIDIDANGFVYFLKRIGQCFEILLMSIHNALRLFIVDTDFESVNTFAQEVLYANKSLKYLAEIYRVHSALLFIISPLFTFTIIANFIYNLSSKLAVGTNKNVKLFIFSELNEKMVVLAKSIKEKHTGEKIKIIFCNVQDKSDSSIKNLIEKTREIRAWVIKNSLEDVNLFKRNFVTIFIAGEDEYEKLDLTATIMDKYSQKENFRVYLFSNTTQSAVLQHNLMHKGNEKQDNAQEHKIKFGIINEVNRVVYNDLYKNGSQIFKKAKQDKNNIINIVIVGAGEYGTQMFKTLLWYCNVIGYKIKFTILDLNKNCLSEYKAKFPEVDFLGGDEDSLPSGKQPNYNVKIFGGINVKSKEFLDIISNSKPSYVFVSVGDDELNLNTAIVVREQCEKDKIKPIIKLSMRSSKIADKIAKATNHKDIEYNVEPIGDIASAYSYDCVIHKDIEDIAKGSTRFWESSYNYDSSIARTIHQKLLVDLGILKPGESTVGNIELNILEHERWNAYTRSLGYKYAPIRNDLAKEHNCLVAFEELTDEYKSYDAYVVPEKF